MDEPTSKSSGRRSRRKRRKLIFKRVLIGLGVIAFLALAGKGALSGYKVLRDHRTMNRARASLEKKSYGEALLSLRIALQRNPRDIEATRMMAELAAETGERAEVFWRHKVAELQPGVLENWIACANAAVRFKDVPAAQEALAGIDEAGKQTAAYHEVAGHLALLLREPGLVKSSVAEAVRIDPKNERLQLEKAALDMGSPDPETRQQARAAVELHAANPTLRSGALRALIHEALLSKDTPRAISLAKQLNFSKGANLQDRLLYLSMLRRAGRGEFWWCLAQLESDIASDPEQVSTLLSWLNRNGLAQAALDWSKKITEAVRTATPVPIAIAESCSTLGDWAGVKQQVTFGDWKDLEFQRHALLARVLRDQGDVTGSQGQWAVAVNLARTFADQTDDSGSRAEALFVLAHLARRWNWEDEADTVLWLIARGNIRQQPALDLLNRMYYATGKTRELHSVSVRQLELKPDDLDAKNNVAYLSLLLGLDLERAHALAREAYKSDPLRPTIVTTYAMSLYLQGKMEQGLKVMRALPESELDAPANALFYGILLADTGARDQARKYLDLAASAQLFPQEQALIAKARERLPRP